MQDSPFSVDFLWISLFAWRPRFLGSDSSMGLYWIPAQPGDLSGHTSRHQNAVCWFGCMALQAWLCAGKIIPQLCFTDENARLRCPLSFLPRLLVFASLSTACSHSPNPHSSRGRWMGLGSTCSPHDLCSSLDTLTSTEVFLISWFWLSRMYED